MKGRRERAERQRLTLKVAEYDVTGSDHGILPNKRFSAVVGQWRIVTFYYATDLYTRRQKPRRNRTARSIFNHVQKEYTVQMYAFVPLDYQIT